MSNRVRPLLSGDTYGARAEARCTVARNRPSVRPDCFPIIVTLPMLSFSGNLFAPGGTLSTPIGSWATGGLDAPSPARCEYIHWRVCLAAADLSSKRRSMVYDLDRCRRLTIRLLPPIGPTFALIEETW